MAATLLILAGCGDPPENAAANVAAPPSVVTLAVQSKPVASSFDYLGRSEASQRVEIRARVSGVLIERPFQEGAELAAGSAMFRIDPAEFDDRRQSAQANVERAQAAAEEAANSLARYEQLLKTDAASIARFDEAKAKDGTARADLAAARAALRTAELDLGYTEIATPIAGRSGRANADVGNLIGPDSGVLATVVQLDPIYVVFSIGERDYLKYVEAKQNGDAAKLTPRIKLADDKLYGQVGKFNLVDNEVDPATGTISIRTAFPNPDRLIVPGQFVNVVLTSEEPEMQVTVPQAAVQENQTGAFVLVVDAKNRVVMRPIKTGQRIGTEIVALDGLVPGESIIVEGIQKVRPGAMVAPTQAGRPRTAATDPK